MTSEHDTKTATREVGARVDVAFPLAGERVPQDHGYALFGALCRVLGDLHGADWLAVHPIAGTALDGGMLGLRSHNLSLRLRMDPAQIPRVLPLAGKALFVDGHEVLVGTSRLFALEPAASLVSRMVVIKGFLEEEPFLGAVRRQLDALGVRTTPTLERRRSLTIAGDRVVGFGLRLDELSDEDSLKVQCAGVGGRQRFGCGVFSPATRRR